MQFEILAAVAGDCEEFLALLPRLAAFDLPAHRTAAELWQGDAEVVRAWQKGAAPDCFLLVARAPDRPLLGGALVRMRPEVLSRQPSAHLEVLVVAENSQGLGIGGALIDEAERLAQDRGAKTITLNVFEANVRARGLYERLGYVSELRLYNKLLPG